MLELPSSYWRRQRIVGLAIAAHPFPAAMNGLGGLLLFVIADRQGAYVKALVLFTAIFLLHAAIGAMNDYVDEQGDRMSNPGKPLVQGAVARHEVLVLSVMCGALGLALAAGLGAGLPVALLILAAGMAYNFWLKGTWLSWAPYAVAIPSVAVWAFLASGSTSPVLLLTYPVGITIAIGLNLANTMPDLEGDAKLGISGLAHRLGARRSRLAIVLLYLLAGLTIGWFGFFAKLPAVGLAALIVGAAAGIGLGLLFRAEARTTLRIGWYASAVAALLLACCWAIALESVLRPTG